jgi:hypothetical protein
MVRHCPTFDCLAYAVVVVCASALPYSSGHAEPRAVVELFTSQGCSSCPAADKLLGELAADPSLVPISVPIDYWDYLGWKDTLADPRNTARQKAYAYARGDGQVYTPQMVVNGSVHALGSDKAAIEHAIAKSRNKGAMSLPPVTLMLADGRLNVTVPDAKDNIKDGRAGGEIWLAALSKSATIAIARGENKGRTVTYHNVVRHWIKLGDWTGKAETYNVPMKDVQSGGINSAAVVVQSGVASAPKLMLGAAQIALQ